MADVVAMPVHAADTKRLVLAAAVAGAVVCGADRNLAQCAGQVDVRTYRSELGNIGHSFEDAVDAVVQVLEPHRHAVERLAYWLAGRRLTAGNVGMGEAMLSPLAFILEDVRPRRLANEELDIEMLQVLRLRGEPDAPAWQMAAIDGRLVSLLAAYFGRDAPFPVRFVWADGVEDPSERAPRL